MAERATSRKRQITPAVESSREIHVIAPDLGEAIRDVGGWIFDQVRAGFRVTIVTCADADHTAARILGAGVVGPDDESASPLSQVAVTVIVGEPGHGAEWRSAADADRAGTEVRHRLGPAAAAFKRHALLAAGNGAPVGDTLESFRVVTGVSRDRSTGDPG